MQRTITIRGLRIACVVLLLCVSAPSVWASQTTVTVTGAEQQASSGTFDSGTVTVMVNGYTETVTYGRFSTNAAVASSVAARFSQDCNSPVIAHASGTAITFVTRDPSAAVSGITASIFWDNQDFTLASFGVNIPQNTTPVITPTFACAPTTIISGENLTCAVTLIVGAQSAVSFSVNGSAWTTATPDQVTGTATANALFTQGAGTYTIAYSYPGDSIPNQFTIPAESGTAQVTVEAQGTSLPGNQVYAFSIVTNGQNGQPASGSQGGYAANSNIQAYTDSVNGNWTLGYDGLNRLTASTQQPTNASPLYGCWAYDSFGNMLTQAISNQTITSGLTSSPYCQTQTGSTTWQSRASYSAANQATSGTWLDATKNTHTGSPGYDGAGDMTNDLVNTYLYDADGRVCAAQGLSGGQPSGAVTGYLYDAEGHRVAKTTLSSLTCDPAAIQQVTAEYFIGPDGETMTEVDPVPSGDMWVRTEVSAAGQFLATYKPYGVHYAITDWLGTKRAQVDPGNTLNANGVDETCTSFAFGDQLNCNTSLDASPRHFTGKERDSESGLDYFGARYFGSNMGRFMSPDPSVLDFADLGNPQSLNLYQYALNNPLKYVDPTGLDQCIWDDGSRDDEPGDGGATQQQCSDQGGNWAGGTDASITVTASSSGNTLTTYDMGYMGGQIAFAPGAGCSAALSTANTNSGAMNRYYNQYQGSINSAANANGIDPGLLGAVGVRESGMQNIAQYGGGQGAGVFQIDLGANPGVQSAQAYNVNFAANFSARMLSSNMTFLGAAHTNFNGNQLAQATAATYNMGLGTHPKGKNISGNPNTIDKGTTGGNYGSNVVALMNNCFHN